MQHRTAVPDPRPAPVLRAGGVGERETELQRAAELAMYIMGSSSGRHQAWMVHMAVARGAHWVTPATSELDLWP